jgi:hypothetical protein
MTSQRWSATFMLFRPGIESITRCGCNQDCSVRPHPWSRCQGRQVEG